MSKDTPTTLQIPTFASKQQHLSSCESKRSDARDPYLFHVVDPGENSLTPLHQNGELFGKFSVAYRGASVHAMHPCFTASTIKQLTSQNPSSAALALLIDSRSSTSRAALIPQ